MGSVDDFLRALESIESEVSAVPDVVHLEMSLTRGRLEGKTADVFYTDGRYILLLVRRSIRGNWESMCFDIGGPAFPFIWSPEESAVCGSIPQGMESELEPVEFAVWYYLDSYRSPVPQPLLDMSGPTDELDNSGLAAMAYHAEMDRVRNIIRSIERAWSLAPESVICEFGDLSMLPAGPKQPLGRGDNVELWWPAALLYLALQDVDVVLSASAEPYLPWESIFDDLPEGGDEEAHIDAFEPTNWTVSLRPPSLMAATRCALRAFRHVAEGSTKKPGTAPIGSVRELRGIEPDAAEVNGKPQTVAPAGVKFRCWKAPMLEGYVIDLLKNVEDPSERDAVDWIAAKSRQKAPSRDLLRKTGTWQNRPQKTPKSRTINEAQSGVSPAKNASVEIPHEEIIDAVLEIEKKLHRQLIDDERAAVAWTLQNAGVDEKSRAKALAQLTQGFRSRDI